MVHPRALSTRASRRIDSWPPIDTIRELEGTTLLQEYITLWHIHRRYSTIYGSRLMTLQPSDLSDDPDRHHLHAQEIELAAHVRLSCAQYLAAKRGMFHGKLQALKAGTSFGPTQFGRITPTGAILGRLYESLGWFEEKWFLPWMEMNEEKYFGPGTPISVTHPASSDVSTATQEQAYQDLPQLMLGMKLSPLASNAVEPSACSHQACKPSEGDESERHIDTKALRPFRAHTAALYALSLLHSHNKDPTPRRFEAYTRSRDPSSSSAQTASQSRDPPVLRSTKPTEDAESASAAEAHPLGPSLRTTGRSRKAAVVGKRGRQRGKLLDNVGKRPTGVTKRTRGRPQKHASVAEEDNLTRIRGPRSTRLPSQPPKQNDIEPKEKAETMNKEKATNAMRQKLAIAMRRQPRIPNAQFFAARRDLLEGPIVVAETQADSEV